MTEYPWHRNLIDQSKSYKFQTYSGQTFDYMNFNNYDFDIEVIARSLSHISRWFGHTHFFYSVAQHSVLVSQFCPTKNLAKWGLMHDCGEAFLGDIGSPLKRLIGPRITYLEDSILTAIAKQHKLDGDSIPKEVTVVDLQVLETERHLITNTCESLWKKNVDRLPISSIPELTHIEARNQFLDKYHELFD